jgi:hypothetical protein
MDWVGKTAISDGIPAGFNAAMKEVLTLLQQIRNTKMRRVDFVEVMEGYAAGLLDNRRKDVSGKPDAGELGCRPWRFRNMH